MISDIHLANEGAYDAVGTGLKGLKKVNFIFGPNGSGKTTISRLVEGSGVFPDCQITWAASSALETRVYNRDFVETHFDAESNIKGIYTLGENVKVSKKIEALKNEIGELNKKIRDLRRTLFGEGEETGKKTECEAISAQFVEDVWNAKRKFSNLETAFTGLNNNKVKFCNQYRNEASTNVSTVRDFSELLEDAATVFSASLSKATALPDQDSSKISELEASAILRKKIIGKEDVDIAALIEKLGNSDWVQQGRHYFGQLDEGQCPFCQQKTGAAFKQSLEAYFDESYLADLGSIDKLVEGYAETASDLLSAFSADDIVESPYLYREAYEKDVAALRSALEGNIERITAKRKEPSTPATLTDTAPLFAEVNAQIGAANIKIKANNETIDNLAARKRELTAQVWKRLLEDTKAIYDKFTAESDSLDAAITSLESKIDSETKNLEVKQEELHSIEKQITSIKPTIDAINKLLKSFGFTNFYLVESSNSGFYEVRRPDGSDAKRTLSEGEKSFITFLYFYYLVGGSFTSSGVTSDKVVVFDDPVSSLDADILFIVCSLIKTVFAEVRAGKSSVKQVFVLTHNIYFHKEVTFDKKRVAGKARSDESFWVVRKTSQRSELIRFEENPVKSSYELLWREIRQKPPSDTAIQNVMRRILEHYFKFYGGVAPEDIIEKFDGSDKMVCCTLLSWVNDGSHFAIDDLCMACDLGQVDRYLNVFQRIFEESDHGGHFRMMMGEDYVALTAPDAEQIGVVATQAQIPDELESVSNGSEIGQLR